MQPEHPLRTFRKSANMSLADLATKVGSTKASLSRIEQGLQTPSLDLVGRLKEATGGAVSADDFLAAPSQPADVPRPEPTEEAA